jgi:hypothetical protein
MRWARESPVHSIPGAFNMTKRFKLRSISLAAAALICSTVATAGEITGPPPPPGSLPGPPGTRISNGASVCSFSGLNDTPSGFGTPGTPTYDPGGIAQSYGYFLAQYGLFDPSDPDKFTSGTFPGENCNPNRGPRLH